MNSRPCVRVPILVFSLIAATTPFAKEDVDKLLLKQRAIDTMANHALERLLLESPRARELSGSAVAYAVFDSLKVSVLLSGGSGIGVAVDDRTGERTYMRMGTGGLGLGLGGQSYQTVFLFETPEAFERFLSKGWQAHTAANAVAGKSGRNLAASFSDGLAVFQMTHKGLMAQADVSGTKYWKSRKLNRP